jgi:plasmid stability protein
VSNLSIKDVPEAWAEALRQRAARNHRSLQGELMSIIEAAAQEASHGRYAGQPHDAAKLAARDRIGYPIARRGWKSIEQIAEEHRQLFAQPVRGGPLAVDIIREDRDAR